MTMLPISFIDNEKGINDKKKELVITNHNILSLSIALVDNL